MNVLNGAIRKKWRAQGYTCNRQTDPPGKVWKEHYHTVHEIVRLLDGEIKVKVANKIRRAVKQKDIVIQPRVVHNIRNPGSRPAHYVYGFRRKAS